MTLADEKVEQPSHPEHLSRAVLPDRPRRARPRRSKFSPICSAAARRASCSRPWSSSDKLAVAAGAHYQGTAVDDTRFYVFAVPAPGVTLERLDAAIDAVIATSPRDGVEEADVQRAKTRLVADAIYAQDNQATLARWYGASLAAGLRLEDVAQWPERIEAVSAEDVKKAARWLDKRRGVTGFLLPAEAARLHGKRGHA